MECSIVETKRERESFMTPPVYLHHPARSSLWAFICPPDLTYSSRNSGEAEAEAREMLSPLDHPLPTARRGPRKARDCPGAPASIRGRYETRRRRPASGRRASMADGLVVKGGEQEGPAPCPRGCTWWFPSGVYDSHHQKREGGRGPVCVSFVLAAPETGRARGATAPLFVYYPRGSTERSGVHTRASR